MRWRRQKTEHNTMFFKITTDDSPSVPDLCELQVFQCVNRFVGIY